MASSVEIALLMFSRYNKKMFLQRLQPSEMRKRLTYSEH